MFEVLNQRPFEDECVEHSKTYLATAPSEFVDAFHWSDSLLGHLYQFSCCRWGCHGKEHVFEYLGGRKVSHALASSRLISTGYYDEAISLVRSIGEIANLLNLFHADNETIRRWLDADKNLRRTEFSPVAVRKKLEKLDWMIPFDKEHYARLCEAVVHPTPTTMPNAYESQLRPVLGAYFQKEGFVQSSWELFWAIPLVAGPIAKLAIFPEIQSRKMIDLTIPLSKLAAHQLNERGKQNPTTATPSNPPAKSK